MEHFGFLKKEETEHTFCYSIYKKKQIQNTKVFVKRSEDELKNFRASAWLFVKSKFPDAEKKTEQQVKELKKKEFKAAEEFLQSFRGGDMEWLWFTSAAPPALTEADKTVKNGEEIIVRVRSWGELLMEADRFHRRAQTGRLRSRASADMARTALRHEEREVLEASRQTTRKE